MTRLKSSLQIFSMYLRLTNHGWSNQTPLRVVQVSNIVKDLFTEACVSSSRALTCAAKQTAVSWQDPQLSNLQLEVVHAC